MRRIFRFSVRDLFWLTLVVAVGLAGFVHERHLRAEVERANSRATKWQGATGALEYVLAQEGHVAWGHEHSFVWVTLGDEGNTTLWRVDLTSHEPTAPCD